MRIEFPSRAVAAVACMFAALASACGRSSNIPPGPRADTAIPVLVRRVKVEPVQQEVVAVGTIWGDEDATIACKVSGHVIAVHKDVGDRTVSGDVLAEIEPIDYELAVREKELAVRESLARVALKELPPEDFDPVEVPTVRRSKLVAENAELKFSRTKQLFEHDPPRVTVQDYDDARTDLDVARSNYDVELLLARSIVQEARTRQADLRVAQQKLDDTKVRVPAGEAGEARVAGDGAGPVRRYAVAQRMVTIGEYAQAGTAIFRLVDDDRLKLRVTVPERYVNDVRVGQAVRVEVDASGQVADGTVARINPHVDPANRTFEVESLVANADHLLHPGSFARARIQTKVDPRVVFVPQEALTSFAGVEKVFVVEDGVAREVEVEPGERKGEWIAVHSELKGDESVVVSGNTKLATGMRVNATEADAEDASTSAPTPSNAPAPSTTTKPSIAPAGDAQPSERAR